MPSITRQTVICNKDGLHARPAMQFVDAANRYRSCVRVQTMGERPAEADGKSVMQMIVLAAIEGTPMVISADGDDADDAVKALVELVESKFGED